MPLPRGAAGRVDLKVNADAAAALGLGEGSFKIICGCLKICFKNNCYALKNNCYAAAAAALGSGEGGLVNNSEMGILAAARLGPREGGLVEK